MKQSLNFKWNFIPDFNNDYLKSLPKDKIEEINIPHNPVEIPYNYFSEDSYQKVFTYEKFFDVDNFDKNLKYFLLFEGFMLKAKIYLNDQELGDFASGYLPVKIEVSSFLKEKNNRLLVILDSSEDENYPPFGFVIDYITYAGIYREVYLESHKRNYIENIYAHADKNGNVNVIYDKHFVDEDVKVKHEVYLEDKLIGTFNDDNFGIESPKLWELSSPILYELVTTITFKEEKEEYKTRFAFRNVSFRKDGFYLNDKKVKLIGLNRHQGYPYMGYAASKALQIDDADILKRTGLNVVRTSHYPQSEHFLNRCDEIGLLVVDEIPGWQHISNKESWRNNCVLNAKNMVLKERNHPCLIAYGVRIDESIDDHELYSKTNQIAHELDPYRQTIGVRNFKNSELLEDIYGYNDFSCDSLKLGLIDPKKVKHMDKPYLVTEFMGHMDPVKPTSDLEKRVEVALRHAKVINDCYKYENISGSIGWCFVDYHTHTDFGSGDHICPHGVYDLYRNPKLTSYIYASQQDDEPFLNILTNMKPGDVPEALFNNIYIATNCEYIELLKDGELVEKFYPKKDMFPNLKHPPILIDDIVGKTFNEGKIPAKYNKKITKSLSYAAMHGFNHLPIKTLLFMGFICARFKISYSELTGYWNKYIGSWGGKAKTYTIKGYIGGEAKKEIEIGPSNDFHYEMTLSKDELVNEDTYDTLKMTIRHLDNHNQLLFYSNRIVSIKTSGPISLVGPANQCLLGGQLTLYFNSVDQVGDAKIIITTDLGDQEFNIKVK